MRKIGMIFVIVILLSFNLVIAEENKTIALEAIQKAENDIKEMIEVGFGVLYVNDALTDAKNAYNSNNYTLVLEKTQLIADKKIQAYEIRDSIRALELGIEDVESLNLNTDLAKELLNKGQIAFQNERYEEAENFISQANTELSNIRAESTLVQVRIRAARENIISFVKFNWDKLVIIVLLLSVAGFITFNKIMKIRTRNKIDDLEIEKEVLDNLIKKAQSDHFQKGILSRESYEIKMKKYKERMIEIKEILPVLKARLRGKGNDKIK